MDYKKEYEAMVQRARELHKGDNALTKKQMEIVCPELAESEDKRVNEEIRNFLIDMECKREWIAYLEKQKEQKPEVKYVYPKFRKGDVIEPITPNGSYTPVRVRCIDNGSYICRSDDNCAFMSLPLQREDGYKIVEQKPAEWSEEDERIQGHIIGILTYYAEIHNPVTEAFIKQDISWLKSLPMGCPKKEEKEIDLDGEITKYWKDISSLYGPVGKEITRFDFEDVCKYFYELGKTARKEK